MKVFNTALASNPVNWIKVNIMAATAFIALYLISQLFSKPEEEQA